MDEKTKIPIAGSLGAGAGITLGVFISEVVTRITGLTGYPRLGAKVVIKLAIGILLGMLSGKFSGLLSFGVEMASYSVVGSIIPDVFEVVLPGGILGAAEVVAVSVRSSGRNRSSNLNNQMSQQNQNRNLEVSQSVF